MKNLNSVFLILIMLIVSLACGRFSGSFSKKNFLEKASLLDAIEAFKEKVGDQTKVSKLMLTKDSAVLSVKEEGKKYDTEYVYSGGWISTKSSYETSYSAFLLDEINPDSLNRVMSESVERSKINVGVVEAVNISEVFAWSDDELVSEQNKTEYTLGFSVTVKAGNDSAVIRFSNDAKFLTANLKETTRYRYADFFKYEEELKAIEVTLKRAFGENPKILSMNFRMNTVYFDAQDPTKPNELNKYMYELDRVRKIGIYKDAEVKRKLISKSVSYDELFIDLNEIDLTLIPRMVEEAKARLEMPEARIFSVSVYRIGKSFGDRNQIEWAVSLNSERKEGSAEFDPKGKLIKAEIK